MDWDSNPRYVSASDVSPRWASCDDPRILMRFEKDRNSVFPKGYGVDTAAKTGAYSSSFSYKVKAVIVDCVRPFIE